VVGGGGFCFGRCVGGIVFLSGPGSLLNTGHWHEREGRFGAEGGVPAGC